MRVFLEPITILEDTSVCGACFRCTGAFERGVGVRAIDIFKVLGHEVEHAPVFLHLAQVFDITGEIPFGGRFYACSFGENTPDMDGAR